MQPGTTRSSFDIVVNFIKKFFSSTSHHQRAEKLLEASSVLCTEAMGRHLMETQTCPAKSCTCSGWIWRPCRTCRECLVGMFCMRATPSVNALWSRRGGDFQFGSPSSARQFRSSSLMCPTSERHRRCSTSGPCCSRQSFPSLNLRTSSSEWCRERARDN